ncbi:uncharacterized protein LOC133198614 [Saccostrea echinata]|uniref:uncharacterized protein LOC133198614 n=1 Tax=Saccostrea echinata TaxID=191078 RepID=UPI002A7F433B|nr:uncharacterized protein LOC133198614 [Saccostrea echinata]
MPATCCSVPGCHVRGGHEFPANPDRRKLWINAVRRLDQHTMKTWVPSKTAVVCKEHFTANDYVQETIHGNERIILRLRLSAVPSIFPWTNQESESSSNRKERAAERERARSKVENSCRKNLEECFSKDDDANIEMQEEVIVISEVNICEDRESDIMSKQESFGKATQTQNKPMFDVENFVNDNVGMHFYTGLETYCKFLFVLRTLGPSAYCLKYIFFQVDNQTISVENQFFMTLMKLRRYLTNFELSRFFSVSESTVKNIVNTWIIFMSKQWQEVNIWPSRSLVKYFAPSDFKAKFPTTRIIVDGTKCPIKKPKAPRAQQATFSLYKNRNTIKILVGSTSGGLVSFISNAYGGSTSDRQIVERCKLVNLCDPKDSVMADKGFNVQDLFARMDVTVNISTFFRKRNRMSGKILLRDRKISSKRVHIERIIGLGKTYKILTIPLNSIETKISSHITFCCYMLCNFRTCIIPKDA